jgi:hypothetical protein
VTFATLSNRMLSIPQRVEAPEVVEQQAVRPSGSGRVGDHGLGEDDAVVTGRDARHDPADQPGEYAVQYRDSFGPRVPAGGRGETVGARFARR